MALHDPFRKELKERGIPPMEYVTGLIVSLLLAAYLVYALCRPDRF